MRKLLRWFHAPVVVTRHVVRHNWMSYSRDCPRGSGYCEDWGSYQLLIEDRHWNGILIGRRTLDREDIPSHVIIQMATIGSCWRSKWHGRDDIDWSWKP